jgi:sugar (pentulose or hexulose) kinase
MVTTTGDYIAACLTDNFFLSTSDGVSNGLLDQKSKELPEQVLAAASEVLLPGRDTESFTDLFPEPIQSGTKCGVVSSAFAPQEWRGMIEILEGWEVISCLGDNHAGGVGSGLDDYRTIVISAGTSGTVIRKCDRTQILKGKASCFEYYKDRLLLLMLAGCAEWYNIFARWYCNSRNGTPDLAELDRIALGTPLDEVIFWSAEKRLQILATPYTGEWSPVPVANAQFSIAIELLMRVKTMLNEVRGRADDVNRFVLTGGMSRSPFFRQVIQTGLGLLVENATVLVSQRTGLLANQAATLGATINAMVGSGHYKSIGQAAAELCPLESVAKIEPVRREQLQNIIRAVL